MFRLKLLALPVIFTLFFSLPLSTHAQTNDPKLSKQDYLETINVFEAWSQAGNVSPVRTAIIGPGSVLSSHEDLSVTIPEGAAKTRLSKQPSTSTFAAGIMHAQANNSTGIAGINSSYNWYNTNTFGAQLLSYEPGKLSDFEGIPDAIYAFDLGAATSYTYEAVQDKNATILLTPVSIPDTRKTSNEISTDLLASPVTVPVLDLDVPGWLANLVEAMGGWIYERGERATKIEEFKNAHLNAAQKGRFSVAPIGDFTGTETMWPAYLSDSDVVFSVGGTTKNGLSRWPKSAKSRSGDPSMGTLDIVAPAERVYSTLNHKHATGNTPPYGRKSSTVGSAAMAAGVAGLLQGMKPNLVGDDLRQILRRTADDIPPSGYDKETGYGRLNAEAAVEYVRNRSITHGTVTNGNVTILEEDLSFMMTSGAWAELASGKYNVDERYKVEWTIDLPKGSDHDVWVRRPGTKGWTPAHPETGLPGANIEIRSWESKATITTYGYQGETDDVLGRRISTYGYPTEAQDAKVAYTIATKPGTPPAPPLDVTLSGPTWLDTGEQGTWTASVSGGSGSPSYNWEYQSVPSSTNWYSAYCSGTSCSHTFFNYSSSQVEQGKIRVTVTKGSEQDQVSRTVNVDPAGGYYSFLAKGRRGAFRSLDARADGKGTIDVRWSTGGSVPAWEFVVQHRTDSTAAWTEVGRVAASDSVRADTSRGASYRFRAENLSVGTHQFRLRVQREGAKSALSSRAVSAEIRLNEAYEVTTYPNPVQSQATIEIAVREKQNVTVAVYDVLGRRVTTLHDGPLPAQETRRLSLSASEAGLSSGTYFVRVRGEAFADTRRLTVVR